MLVDHVRESSRLIERSAHVQALAIGRGVERLSKEEQTVEDRRLSCVVASENDSKRLDWNGAAVGKAPEVLKSDTGNWHRSSRPHATVCEPFLSHRRLSLPVNAQS